MDKAMIKLNVRGNIFEITKDTLMKADYFSSLFSRWGGKNELIIDEDPELFGEIMRYLENPDYVFPMKKEIEDLILYYGIKYDILQPYRIEHKKKLRSVHDWLFTILKYTRWSISNAPNAQFRLNTDREYFCCRDHFYPDLFADMNQHLVTKMEGQLRYLQFFMDKNNIIFP